MEGWLIIKPKNVEFKDDAYKKFRNETQGPHVFFFTLLVMLGTMNLLALLP